MIAMSDESRPPSQESSHEMPPMGNSLLAWGFAGVFLMPLVLIVLIFATPMCSPRRDGLTGNPMRLPQNISPVEDQP